MLKRNKISFYRRSEFLLKVCRSYFAKSQNVSFSQKTIQKIYPRRIFSGIQPTGSMHIGNYLGVIKKWVELQESKEDVIWSIVDLHSITLSQDPKKLSEDILKMTATLLACGISPQKSILFQQSSVPMHTQLSWVLGCISTMPRLGHLPQFKEKSQSIKDIPLGLYIYPVLQAADILLYRATHVPIGQDQVQHIQLAQDLAESFNKKFGNLFPIPHSMLSEKSNRIKSLRDPNKKMSKSEENPKGRLDLLDEPHVLRSKIKKAVTDFNSAVTYEPENRPGVSNLVTIHSLLVDKTPEEICKEAEGLETAQYKLLLGDVIVSKLAPIQEEISKLLEEPHYLQQVLEDGNRKATEIATNCWLDVQKKIGFNIENLCNKRDTSKLRKIL